MRTDYNFENINLLTQEELDYIESKRAIDGFLPEGREDYMSKAIGKELLEIKNKLTEENEYNCFCGKQDTRLVWKKNFFFLFDKFIKYKK